MAKKKKPDSDSATADDSAALLAGEQKRLAALEEEIAEIDIQLADVADRVGGLEPRLRARREEIWSGIVSARVAIERLSG